MILLATVCFSSMSVFVRLSGNLPLWQKAFFRNSVAFIIAVAYFVKEPSPKHINKKNLLLFLLRAVIGTIGLLGNYYAIDRLVLSDASMLNKLSPFFATVFSFFLLGEKIDKKQLIIIVTGFIGSIFIIKPTFSNSNLGATLIGFIGGMASGLAYTTIRMLCQRGEKSVNIVMIFSGLSCLIIFPMFVIHYQPMSFLQVFYLLMAGVMAAGGQFSITHAYNYAPAREISVYDYTQVIFTALWAYLLFDQVADGISILGYVVIIGAGFAMFLHNKKQTSRQNSLKSADLFGE